MIFKSPADALRQGQGPINIAPQTKLDPFSRIVGLPGQTTQYAHNAPSQPAYKFGQSSQTSTPAPPRPYMGQDLPPIDYAGMYARAKKNASAAVSPLYQQKLQNFLGQMNLRRQEAAMGRDKTIEGVDLELGQYKEDADVRRGRTEEDYFYNLQQLSTEEEARKQMESFGFEQDRRNLQDATAEANLTFSGVGREQEENILKARGMSEEAKAREVKANEYAQETFKTRTLEDISRGVGQKEEYADHMKGWATKEYDHALADVALSESIGRLSFQLDEMRDVMTRQQDYLQTEWQNYLSRLNPEQRGWASQYMRPY